MESKKTVLAAVLVLAAFLSAQRQAAAYSVLAHEANIDALWDSTIQPLLAKRFPQATREQLKHARAFAYGGSVIQDLGYYPFGNHFFSNLLHYVRSGDFVETMLHEARDVNEYGFALGALAHYAADNAGHPEAVNRAVALGMAGSPDAGLSVLERVDLDRYQPFHVAHAELLRRSGDQEAADGAYARAIELSANAVFWPNGES